MIKSLGFQYILFPLLCLLTYSIGMTQPTLDPDLKKPKKYENRILRAEKTGEKKFTAPRRFFQNTYTHYNYVFNAETKLARVLEAAKRQHLDDFSELLPFYNYSLESTAAQKTELDSVIYKVNAGVFLHDLRSNWMDNLYLAMGQAYFLRKTFDTAYMTFHYMNYAFHPKDPDGYDRVIASNSYEGGDAMKISNLEKRNIIDKAFTRPPSRNDALLWLIRTHIERAEMGQASTLIQSLRNDPQFPERLTPRLEEMQALWYYNEKQYDSAAYHLELALPAAFDKQEAARWEFLAGQLYNRSNKKEAARAAFESASRHTLNPIMEVAAQLELAQLLDGADGKDWRTVVQTLEKMARREKYYNYRDLIYYTIGKLEYEHQELEAAHGHLLKSIKNSLNNPEQKSRTWLLLGDLSFEQHKFPPAKNYYDSLDVGLLSESDGQRIAIRKDVLALVVEQLAIIHRQDSLQALAAMPEEERMDFLKKKLRQLKKQQAADEAAAGATTAGNIPGFPSQNNQAPSDMFAKAASGDFYFYNNSMKSRGFTEFRNRWGNRANTDNWRLSANQSNAPLTPDAGKTPITTDEPTEESASLSVLMANIPMTQEAYMVSQDSIAEARYIIAITLQNKLEDYAEAASNYEWILENDLAKDKESDILYNLAICYRMLGKTNELKTASERLQQKFPNSRQAQLATNPVAVIEADSLQSKKATQTYDQIYMQYLTGQFEQAATAKRAADSVYGNHHWTPQLLYIQAVYHIKQQEDSTAIGVLMQLRARFPDHALAVKSNTLIDVLKRRKQIEEYLTNLDVERQPEDSLQYQAIPQAKKAVVKTAEPEPTAKPPVVEPEPQPREAKAAVQQPKTNLPKPSSDSSRLNRKIPELAKSNLFSRHAEQPHFVVIVLKNVDPVYVNETKNAFDRYHREKYYNQPMNVAITSLTDSIKMVSIRGLTNEAAALDYIERAKALAERDIIPWLKKDLYYFLPVAEDNMNLLMDSKNLPAYQDFLNQLFPQLFK